MHTEGMKRVIASHITDKIPEKFNCRVCIESKHQVVYSKIPATRSEIPFERIYPDMCGLFRVTSVGNFQYFIVYERSPGILF